jgi:hypothetical protein
MDLDNLHHFCGIANKKDHQGEVKVFGDSEVLLFNTLQKNGMLFFKDNKNGTICRAMGFLFSHKKFGWDRIESLLIDAGMTQKEAMIQINNEKTLLSLYANIQYFRENYNAARAKISPVNRFGDWLLMSKKEFFATFRNVFDSSIPKVSEYNVCLMRDESGIPTSLHVYSPSHRFMGTISLGLTDSTIAIQYNKTIDNTHWNIPRQILSQEIDIASFVDTIMMEESKIPVGLIVTCGSIPNYGSVCSPITYWVAKYDESPHKIINFFDGENSLYVHRLPNKQNESFVSINSFSSSYLSSHSLPFCSDIARFATKTKTSEINDFVQCYLASSSINRESKAKLIKEYCKRIGMDYDSAIALVKKYGIGADTLTVDGKTYFVSDGKYCVSKRGSNGSSITNFFVQPETVYSIDGKRHVVEGFFVVGGQSAKFTIDRDSFIKSNKFLDELTDIADKNGFPVPVVYAPFDIRYVRRIIISAIENAITKNINELGFNGQDSYISSWWKVSNNTLKIEKEQLLLGGQSDTFNVSLKDMNIKYEDTAMGQLRFLCKTESTKTLIFLLIKAINTKLNHGTCRLYLSSTTLDFCAKILGCKISSGINDSNQFQASSQDCTLRFARTHDIMALVQHRGNTSKSKECIVFLEDVNSPIDTLPLLPMIMLLALNYSPTKSMHLICGTDYLGEEARASKLAYSLHGGEAKDFFDNLKELHLFNKYAKEDENGSLVIELVKALKDMEQYGVDLNKKSIVKDLRDIGVRFEYPVRRYYPKSTSMVVDPHNKAVLKSLIT